MNCSGCNSAIAEDEVLCPQCGLRIVREELSAPPLPDLPVDAAPVEPSPLPPFFAVSLWKLAVMSFFTLGLYELYWFYRNWQRMRVREQKNISPAVRVFFGVVFCYPCFRRIRSYGIARGFRQSPPIELLALLWVVTELSGGLPEPLLLISLCSVLFLLPVQAYVNRINAAEVPTHDRNARFTGWNWVWIGIGASLLLLNLIGFLLPLKSAPSV